MSNILNTVCTFLFQQRNSSKQCHSSLAMHLQATHSRGVSFIPELVFLNKSFEWLIQWFTHKDSVWVTEWISSFEQIGWLNNSLWLTLMFLFWMSQCFFTNWWGEHKDSQLLPLTGISMWPAEGVTVKSPAVKHRQEEW